MKYKEVFVILIAVFALLVILPLGKSSTSGPILYYSFEKSLSDSSGRGFNGVQSGDLKYLFNTNFNNHVASFNGVNSSFAVKDSLDLNAYTISIWLRLHSLKNQNIIARTASNNPDLGFHMQIKLLNSSFYHSSFDTTQNNIIGAKAEINKWYHLAGVASGNGGMLRFYIDGVEQPGALSLNSSLWSEGDNYYIGRAIQAGYNESLDYFDGDMDQLRVYDRVLTSQEIISIYDSKRIQFSSNSTLVPVENTQIRTCSDSDNGLAYFVKGTINLTINQQINTFTDFCLNDSALIEYSCNNSLAVNSTQICAFGCDNGICKSLPFENNSCLVSSSTTSFIPTKSFYFNGKVYSPNERCSGTACYVGKKENNDLFISSCSTNCISGTCLEGDPYEQPNNNATSFEFSVDPKTNKSLFVDVPLIEGIIRFPLLYGDGKVFLGLGNSPDRGLAVAESAILKYSKSDRGFFYTIDKKSYYLNLSVYHLQNSARPTTYLDGVDVYNRISNKAICLSKTSDETCEMGEISLRVIPDMEGGADLILVKPAASSNRIYDISGNYLELPIYDQSYTGGERPEINLLPQSTNFSIKVYNSLGELSEKYTLTWYNSRLIISRQVSTNPATPLCSSGCSVDVGCLPTHAILNGQYCGDDGYLKTQKAEKNNCTSNYECLSNNCLSGVCELLATNKPVAQSNGFKGFLVKVLCKVGNLFDKERYQSCVFKYSKKESS